MALAATDRRTLSALRLSALGLAAPASTDPGSIVRGLLAMQAQDFAGAKLSVGLRGNGLTEADVDAALADGTIVRSWPMRGTLHLTAPEDLRWMLRIAARRQATSLAKRRQDLAIADDELARAEQVAVELLSGGRVLQRSALLDAFVRAGVPTDGQRGYHLLTNLAHHAVIVFGPPEGKQQTFALFDEWIRDSRELDGDEALAELALRYFTAHGPATVADLAWWSSVPLGQARTGLALVADRLQVREFDGIAYWSAPGLEPAAGAIHLLPGFDEFMLGYQDRSVVLAPEHAQRIVPGHNGVFQPTIVVDGAVAGTWSRTVRRRGITIEPDWFAPPTARARKGAQAAVARIGAFAGTAAAIG